jgi:cytochrome c
MRKALDMRILMPLLIAALPAAAGANEALARKHGCLGCHAPNAQLVGPSYAAVAERYSGQADASARLVAKLRQGGSGNWGDIAMPPQPGLPEADAKRLVSWILRGAKKP